MISGVKQLNFLSFYGSINFFFNFRPGFCNSSPGTGRTSIRNYATPTVTGTTATRKYGTCTVTDGTTTRNYGTRTVTDTTTTRNYATPTVTDTTTTRNYATPTVTDTTTTRNYGTRTSTGGTALILQILSILFILVYFCRMTIQLCSLNSGSNANCYYIGNSHEAVLIDAGLSCRETERRMKLSGLLMENVKALFISHEHIDHITGMAGIAKKYRLPVYVTNDTLLNSKMPVDPSLVRPFKHAKPVTIGHFTITPFNKSHDAADPHSFIVSAYGINTGIITDIGYACKRVIKYFGQCHVAFLESNYCDDMLTNGSYPWHLKKRISSDEGHLSNAQALELFLHYRSADLRLLILSHLSKNNNKPTLVEEMFTPHAGATQIFVASRYEASPVFTIEGNAMAALAKKFTKREKKDERQLSLF